MKNINLLFAILIFFVAIPSAIIAETQAHHEPTFEYYIFISGVEKREDVLSLQELIQHKNDVTFFMAERFPVRCFVLKTTRPVSSKEFESWIDSKYKLKSYGEGNKGKERAYFLYNKQKKSNPKS